MNGSIIHGEEDRLWSSVDQEVNSVDGCTSGPAFMKSKLTKKKQVC